jgi:hypothetical protein
MIESRLFARLMSINNSYFNFRGCNFSMKNMSSTGKKKLKKNSKTGTGRVALFIATGHPHCYTMELNYKSAKFVNNSVEN